jgi:hypothetical protein
LEETLFAIGKLPQESKMKKWEMMEKRIWFS